MSNVRFSRFSAIGMIMIAIGSISTPTQAKPLNFVLPDDQTQLANGPGLDIAASNCGACHSAEYIKSQPHGPDFGKAFWQAEVTKMINVYKAPIAPGDVNAIVDYLTATYK